MDESFYKSQIEKSPLAYAYHKIVYDENKRPCDYIFVEVNRSFELLTGLKREDILGKKVSEVIPGIIDDKFDWIKFYGNIVIKGDECEFEQYSEPLGRWYKVTVYSPEKDYFVTVFSDVSKEYLMIEQLRELSDISEEYLQMRNKETDYMKIANKIRDLTGAKFVIFNLYEESGKCFTTKAISGDSSVISKAVKMLGMKLEGKKWEHDSVRYEKIRGQTITRFEKLSDLTGKVLPMSVIDTMAKMFGIGETVLVKIARKDLMIGDFTIIMAKGKNLANEDIVEIYSNQLGLVIEREKAEKKNRDSENLLNSIFQSIQDGISVLDSDMNIIKVNHSMEELYSHKKPLIGKKCYEVYKNQSYPCDDCPSIRALKKREVFSQVVPLLEKGRKKGWLEIFAYPLFDSRSGSSVGVVNFVRDITERKNIEEDLEIKSLVLDQIQDRVTVTDLNGKIKYVNFPEIETMGYSNSELLNSSTQIYGEDPEKGATQQEIVERTLRQGKWRGEVMNRTKEGNEVIYDTRTQVIKDKEGNEYALAGISTDITERKETESQLFLEKEKFKTTLISLGDGVISTDPKGNVDILNPVAEKLTGWKQEDATGKPVEEIFNIIDEETKRKTCSPVKNIFDTGLNVELRSNNILVSKDGKEIHIEDSAAPIRDREGNITGVVVVFRDFTEKKKSLERIKYLSFHDSLTDLYNRRFFEEELKRLDTKNNLPLTIIMGDVNGLKIINDSFGHARGDDLLMTTAKSIKKSFEKDVIISRTGGDEFTIILPMTDKVTAQKHIKKIKHNLKNEEIEGVEISVSFGYAAKEKTNVEMESILKEAEDDMYNRKLYEGPSVRGKIIENIVRTLHIKSKREENHSKRVSKLCEALAEKIGIEEFRVKEIKTTGLLHDIGKITIDDKILNKPDRLNEKEWIEMRRHTETGYRILSTSNEMAGIAEYILAHHERWDGKGYPKGLKREQIPIEARILAIADAYDAMTTQRPYRKAMSKEEAIQELNDHSGKQFDPHLVDVFIKKVLAEGI